MDVAESNAAIVREFFRAFYSADAARLDELVAPDFTTHAPGGGSGDIDGWKSMADQMTRAVPDIETTIEDLVADETKVAVRYTSSGTHSGQALFGVEASGRRLTMTGIEIYHLAGGRLTEVWGEYDISDLFRS